MDIPLLIAILALLTWTLLPQLDRYADGEYSVDGKPSRLQRRNNHQPIARPPTYASPYQRSPTPGANSSANGLKSCTQYPNIALAF